MSQVALDAGDSLIGQLLDQKYRVLHVIGRGGMGVVYEAEHTALGNRVAIKLMLEKYNNDTEAMTRFTREAHAASRIGNPHIIQVLDIGTAPDGRAFVVMELLTGQPLSRLMEREGPLPPQRALSIMRQVLRAVGAAHAKGIVHRDLKPDNIFLLDREGDEGRDFVKLLDFGISKIIDPDLQVAATRLTTTGVVMGTPLYMAPEQAMGADITHQADIYACGVMLYEMLAGRPPFEGHTYAVLVAKLLTTDPPLLSDLRPGLSPKLVAAVHRALEKEPTARHASSDAFIAALPQHQSASALELAGTMASGKVVAVSPVRPSTGGSRKMLLAVGLAVLAGIGTATAIILQSQGSSSTARPAETPGSAAVAELTPAPSPAPLAGSATTRTTTTVTPIATTGKLVLRSNPSGAAVTIDDNPSTTANTPYTVTLEAGTHKIHVELAGYTPFETTAELIAGETTNLPITLGKGGPAKTVVIKNAPSAGRTSPSVVKATPAEDRPVTAEQGGGLAPGQAGVRAKDPVVPPPPPPILKPEKKGPGLPTGPGAMPNPY